MPTYSFLDVQATITGPGGSFSLGVGAAGVGEEGIAFEMIEEKNAMTIGADGEGMHSLRASKAAKVTVHLLKTSPTNKKLSDMYNLQTHSSALHGVNVITISNPQTGDQITCQQAAFVKHPNVTYSKDGDVLGWEFHAIKADTSLAGLLLSAVG